MDSTDPEIQPPQQEAPLAETAEDAALKPVTLPLSRSPGKLEPRAGSFSAARAYAPAGRC